MAPKLDAVLAHGAQSLERENLEPARIRKDRTIPSHEPVETPEIANQLVARPKVQVIRVAENHLRTERAQIVRVERLHRRLRSDRHECRCVHKSVWRD